MLRRLCSVIALSTLLVGTAAAQVVRFETTIGEFEMVLNPTDNPILEDYVDNFVQYVEARSYDGSWINRADTGFVLQMGGFYSNTRRPPATIDNTRNFATFDPVLGQPAAETGLSNTVGTVALALPGLPSGGTNQDAGTSSFFINLTSNAFLDTDFTVFAAVPDMTVVNQIMALMTIDRTQDPDFGAGPGNLAFTDVPIDMNNQQVFIKRAFLLSDAMAIARATAGVVPTMALSASAFDAENSDGGSSAVRASLTIPEPGASVLFLFGAAAVVNSRRLHRHHRRPRN